MVPKGLVVDVLGAVFVVLVVVFAAVLVGLVDVFIVGAVVATVAAFPVLAATVEGTVDSAARDATLPELTISSPEDFTETGLLSYQIIHLFHSHNIL